MLDATQEFCVDDFPGSNSSQKLDGKVVQWPYSSLLPEVDPTFRCSKKSMPFNPLKGITALCCRRKSDISKKSSKNSMKQERKSIRSRSSSNSNEDESSRQTAGKEGSSSSKSSKEKPRIISQEDDSAIAKQGRSNYNSGDEVTLDYWANPEGIMKKDEKNQEEKKKANEIEEDDMHTAIATEAKDDSVVLAIMKEPSILPDLPSKEKTEEEKKAKKLESPIRGQKQIGSAETENIQAARAGSGSRKRQKFKAGKRRAAAKVLPRGAAGTGTPKDPSKRILCGRKIWSARSLRQKAKILAKQTLKRLSIESVKGSRKGTPVSADKRASSSESLKEKKQRRALSHEKLQRLSIESANNENQIKPTILERRQKFKLQEDDLAKAKQGRNNYNSGDEVTLDYWANPEGIMKKDEKNQEENKKADEMEEDDLHTAIASEAEDDRVVLTIVDEPGILPDLHSKEKIEEEKKVKGMEFFRRDQKQVGSAETENIQAARAGAVRKKQKPRRGKQQAAAKLLPNGASVGPTPKNTRKRMLRPGKISTRSLRQKAMLFAKQTTKRLSAEGGNGSQKGTPESVNNRASLSESPKVKKHRRPKLHRLQRLSAEAASKKNRENPIFLERGQKTPKFVKARNVVSEGSMRAKHKRAQRAYSAEQMAEPNMIEQELPRKASTAEVLMKSQEKLSNERTKGGSDEKISAQTNSKPMKPTIRKPETKQAVPRPEANKMESAREGKVKSQGSSYETIGLMLPPTEREHKADEDH